MKTSLMTAKFETFTEYQERLAQEAQAKGKKLKMVNDLGTAYSNNLRGYTKVIK